MIFNLCENCENFIQHYQIVFDSAYKVHNSGHCCITGKHLTSRKIKQCLNFKPKKVITEEEKKNEIKQQLIKIEENLQQINEYIENTKKD